ncbi:MAG: hypothetical protein AB8B97_14105 [Granulosicoccus sp.]
MNNKRVISVVFSLALTLNLPACSIGDEVLSSAEEAGGFEPSPAAVELVQAFEPASLVRISRNEGGLVAELDNGDRFARDHDSAGDVNGDGIIDLVVGARSDDDGATDAGAAYILFMNADGSVNTHQKISALEGGFSDELVAGSFFGYGVAGIGDYNGDDIPDIAVSAPAAPVPTIYILHLESDGTVKSMVSNPGIVGQGLSAIGDLNDDGRIDLVAAEPGAVSGGRIRILFFDQTSLVSSGSVVTIGEGMGGFGTGLTDGDSFGGRESALLGDLDNDGNPELAVGAFESENGLGAIWILSLDEDTHQVIDKFRIAPGTGEFNETIPLASNANGTTGGHFGHAIVAAGDLNGDTIPDLISSANQYNDGVGYILYLNEDKTIRTFTRINAEEGGFDLPLAFEERFGRSISIVDQHRNDGQIVVNMGGGAGSTGSVYALHFHQCDYQEQDDNQFWTGGETLFSNWDHATQVVSGSLSLEQCMLQAVYSDAPNITFKESDGRCIIKDSSAVLSPSEEGSSAFVRSCPSL